MTVQKNFGKIELRAYQEEIINKLRLSIKNGNKRIVLCSPTGSGKTIMFTFMVAEHLKKGGRALILTHRKELLKQAGSVFERFGLAPEFITAGSAPDYSHSLHVGMVETINRRNLGLFMSSKTLIIIDEAHINNFTKLFDLINHECVVIGATATPYRKGKTITGLDEFYTDIVQIIDTPELIKLGYLSEAKSYGVEINLKGLKKTADDFDTSKYYDQNKTYCGVVDNYIRLCNDKKAILFASNVESSLRVCEEFRSRGIEAKHIDANTPKQIRESILDWFEACEGGVLCNCGILTAGYDNPKIETIILYRATTSLPLFLQMCGRGSRIAENKKNFIILDFGNNIQRLGFWEDARVWSLKKVEQRTLDKQDAGMIKFCKKCGAMLRPSTKMCPYCGEVKKKTIEEEIAELVLLPKREQHNLGIREKVLLCKAKKMNGFAVLHSFKPNQKDEARAFISMMGYSKYFEKLQGHRFNVFKR